jgi:hypothetical protein
MESTAAGWRTQYDRMLRSYERLDRAGHGGYSISSVDAEDALVHFFQDAYHLKDWIKNDGAIRVASPEKLINAELAMQICADLANGSKHLKLDHNARLGARTPSKHIEVLVGGGTKHRWTVTGTGVGDNLSDAHEVAAKVIECWDDWLKQEGLLPRT